MSVLILADEDIAVPSAQTFGQARVLGANYVQDLALGPPAAGYFWRAGPQDGPLTQVTLDANGRCTIVLATVASGDRPNAAVQLTDGFAASEVIILDAIYPALPSNEIQLTGDFSVESDDWQVGSTYVVTLPTSTTPGVAMVTTIRYWTAATGGTISSSWTLAHWPGGVIAADAATFHVDFILTVTAPDKPTKTLGTTRQLVTVSNGINLKTTFTPQLAAANNAAAHPLRDFYVFPTFPDNNEGVAVQDSYGHTVVMELCLEGFSGQTRNLTGIGVPGKTRFLTQMRRWLNNDKAPCGRSGYQNQYEMRFYATAAILRASADLWNTTVANGGLSADEKRRLDFVMKSGAISSCWVMSTQNPFLNTVSTFRPVPAGDQRSPRGYKAQRSGVPNYSTPPRLTPFIIDAYLRLQGSSLQKFLFGNPQVGARSNITAGATPTFGAATECLMTMAAATTITAFTGGTVGQEVQVSFGNGNTTVRHDATFLKLRGGANKTYGPGDATTFKCTAAAVVGPPAVAAKWEEIPYAGFDRDAFAKQIFDAGDATALGSATRGPLQSLYETYGQTWTIEVMRAAHPGCVETYAPGPSKLMLHHALRTGFPDGIFTLFGNEVTGPATTYNLTQASAMFEGEIARTFSKTVFPGPSVWPDGTTALAGRETTTEWPVGHGYKPTKGIAANIGKLRGVITKTAWKDLPNPGALGMINEFDAVDGGGLGQPAFRSCASYVWHGTGALATCLTAGIITGILDRSKLLTPVGGGTNPTLARRIEVGIVDFDYRSQVGQQEYSKGNEDMPNNDWDIPHCDANNGKYLTFIDCWRMILKWMGITLTLYTPPPP